MICRARLVLGLRHIFVAAPIFLIAPAQVAAPVLAEPSLRDVTETVGLHFEHDNGHRDGEPFYFPEIAGSGVAVLDVEGDGDLDVYLVQSGSHDPSERTMTPDRLFLNQLEKGRLHFVDATAAAGLSGASGYGMGVATGDIDNDGWTDLFVANYGANQLWRNLGDGSFEDVTAKAGVGDPRWSTSASFVDYDRDGDLDLYVTNYVMASLKQHVECRMAAGMPTYCGPQNFTPERDQLLRNLGDGTFEDVSAVALGPAWNDHRGAGLGVVTADFDADGWIDIYVANDLAANHLWINGRDGTFSEQALLSGCALSGDGEAEASMGVVASDLDDDGDVDLFMSHLDQQTNTFYRNEGDGFFIDSSLESGLGNPSWTSTGFGTALLDADGDGHLDLYVTNGGVKHRAVVAGEDRAASLRELDQLFLGDGAGGFREAALGTLAPTVGRGVAAGDLDNDGDIDLVTSANDGAARVVRNGASAARAGGWTGWRVVDSEGRDALGSIVRVQLTDGRLLHRAVASDGSYGSARDPRVLFSLRPGETIQSVAVRWSDGDTTWTPMPAAKSEVGAYHRLTRPVSELAPSPSPPEPSPELSPESLTEPDSRP